MKTLKKRIGQLWTLWFLSLFVTSFLLQYPIYVLLLQLKSTYPLAHRLRVGWAWFLFVGIGLRVQVKHEAKLKRRTPYIYCANHTSYLDIPILAAAVPGTSHFMAKHELTKIPLFGIFFRTIDIAVPRSHRRGSHRAFEQAMERVKRGGNIMIFPEGGIFPGAPMLKAFKSGAFRLAIANNIPIVPVSLIDNWQILEDAPWPALSSGKSRVVVHAPIYPADVNYDEALLRHRTYEIIDKTLKSYHEN